jgi:hypothetical protein
MRKILAILFAICGMQAHAINSHGPQYKCINTQYQDDIKYLFMGKIYPPVDGLDYSKEVFLATEEEFLADQVPLEFQFILSAQNGDGLEFQENILGDDFGVTISTMNMNQDQVLSHKIDFVDGVCVDEDGAACEGESVYQCSEQTHFDQELSAEVKAEIAYGPDEFIAEDEQIEQSEEIFVDSTEE